MDCVTFGGFRDGPSRRPQPDHLPSAELSLVFSSSPLQLPSLLFLLTSSFLSLSSMLPSCLLIGTWCLPGLGGLNQPPA